MGERDDAVAWLEKKRVDFSQGTNTAAQRHVDVLLEMIDEKYDEVDLLCRRWLELGEMMVAAGLIDSPGAASDNIHLLRMFLPS